MPNINESCYEKHARTAKTGQPAHFHSLIKNSDVCKSCIIQLFCKHKAQALINQDAHYGMVWSQALINQDAHYGMVFLCSRTVEAWYGSDFFKSNSYSTKDLNNNNNNNNNNNIFLKTNKEAESIFRLAE